MAVASNAILRQHLNALNARINAQVDAIQRHQKAERPDLPSIYELRYPDGKYVMPEILAAQAQVLNALAQIGAGK